MRAELGLLVSGFGLFTNIVGVSLPFWRYYKNREISAHFGLWLSCLSFKSSAVSTYVCTGFPLELTGDKLQVARCLEFIGMFGMVATQVCVLLKLAKIRDKNLLPKVAGAIAILSGILMIIGCIVFSTWDIFIKEFKLHAGFALCIVAGVISMAAGVCILLTNKNE